MKVLITRSSENQTIGGAELSARDQAIVLKKLGHTPVFSSNNRSMRQLLDSRDIRTAPNIYLQRFRPPLRYMYFWLMLPVKAIYDLLLVLVIQPDVVNPHTREDQITFTLLKPIHRRPVVWKDPGDMIFILNQSHGRLGSIYKSLYLYAAEKADFIYMLNGEHVDELTSSSADISRSKVTAIPSSILYGNYNYSPSAARPEVVFGSVCRLETNKNIIALIKAFSSLSDQLPDASLVIVGDGPERVALEKLAGDNPRIQFTGYTDDISPHLSSIDIFVHPALAEGWGRNIKEAMYFGKAIIGSNLGGIAQQIVHGETGLLVEPGNQTELRAAMLTLANDAELRHKLSSNARKKALDDGDFTDIVEREIVPIYESVVN